MTQKKVEEEKVTHELTSEAQDIRYHLETSTLTKELRADLEKRLKEINWILNGGDD